MRRLFVAVLLTASYQLLTTIPVKAQSPCTLSAPTATNSSLINLTLNCPNAPFFKYSEIADMDNPAYAPVTVKLNAIAPDLSYVDLDIQSSLTPVSAQNPLPFSVTSTKTTAKVLLVLFDFGDPATGGDLGKPLHLSPAWAEKLLMNGNFDGMNLPNSIKHYIEQNSYGTATITGQAYPEWVHIKGIQNYRSFDLSPNFYTQVVSDIVESIVSKDPSFFYDQSGQLVNDYDFLIALSPGGMGLGATGSYAGGDKDARGIFQSTLIMDMPTDNLKLVNKTIYDEPQISYDATAVITKYSPSNYQTAVSGVWLASDPNHEGTNYFTGGRADFPYNTGRTVKHFITRYLELGTPLPATHSSVLVTYIPQTPNFVINQALSAVTPPDTLIYGSDWYSFFLHELFHVLSFQVNPLKRHAGDLYNAPFESNHKYDLMSQGLNYINISNYQNCGKQATFSHPALSNGYLKMRLGYLEPYTLPYGNSQSIRLYRLQEPVSSNPSERIKLIKIPLNYQPYPSFHQLASSTLTVNYKGEEYLLLEWRPKTTLIDGSYNFDQALPYQGLLAYHIIESDPNASAIGYHTKNMVRLLDATPGPFTATTLSGYINAESDSLRLTAAPFGPDSNTTQFTFIRPYQWKATDSATTTYQLSQGSGTKTIYAKFTDLAGNVVAQTQANIEYNDPAAPPVNPYDLDSDNDTDFIDLWLRMAKPAYTVFTFNKFIDMLY